MKNWPYQVTPYLSALPGVAAPGLDISNGDLPSKVYFVTSDADTSVGGPDPAKGPNCFSGTFRWCWTQDQGADFSKFVINLIGGYIYLGRRVTGPAGRGNFDYIGHSAPGAGCVIRCCGLRLGGGSNQRVWHLASWLGDEPSAAGVVNFTSDFRDCLGASQDTHFSTNTAFINCEARFSMDEAAEIGFYAMDGISWIRGAVYDPLHVPPDFALPPPSHHLAGVDHGYGMLIGGSDFCDHSVVMQSVFAHTTDRNPLVCANNHAHINNLHYNHGRSGGGRGAGCKIQDNGGFNAAAGKSMQANVVGNVTVMGPEQVPTKDQVPVLAEAVGAFPAGSSAHVAHNAQFGWTSLASQDDLMRTVPSPDYLRPMLRFTAWHAGLGYNYAGMLKPCADPLNPKIQEGLEFVDLMRRTAGMMPARRYRYADGLNKTLSQIENAIRGSRFGQFEAMEYINTVAECGGWCEMPTIAALDPTQPNEEWWHAPLPLGPERDEIVLSGVLADGRSAVGLSRLRVWIINQYHHVMGR